MLRVLSVSDAVRNARATYPALGNRDDNTRTRMERACGLLEIEKEEKEQHEQEREKEGEGGGDGEGPGFSVEET